ncbi:MAG: hypothetical protein RBS56_00505 [Candidatus Gracilibacteria bacterium]|jgi:hypothetical protein|nr:hypothetical protein [Candidatus Gracilibacteria bacterium]
MQLNIPFFLNDNDGNQCMQVTMKTVLKYFLDKDFTLEELDKLTGRKNGLWTWTTQAITVLDDLGLNIKYYSKTDLAPFLEGEPFIHQHFGKDAEKILKYSDLPVVIASIKKSLEYNFFENRVLPFEEIEAHISRGHIPIMGIDHNKIIGKNGEFQGHIIIVTGFDEQFVYYHDSGPNNPEQNKKISKSTFLEAWNSNGTDNDVVIVYGRK